MRNPSLRTQRAPLEFLLSRCLWGEYAIISGMRPEQIPYCVKDFKSIRFGELNFDGEKTADKI